MRKKTDKSLRQKNQLIPKPAKEKRPWYVIVIIVIGSLILAAGVVWGIALWGSVAPPIGWLIKHWPEHFERGKALLESSHFGHAFVGPMELATLGTIILSFVHVIHQLRAQNHTEKTRFQPVVTCVAFLAYDVAGSDKPERIQIIKPLLKIRLRNLGDSPATFINVQVTDFYYLDSQGKRQALDNTLKIKSLQFDSLGKHDAILSSEYEAELSEPDLPDIVCTLISGILHPKTPADLGRLELNLTVQHENVMDLEYTASGTFFWSKDLYDRNVSDRDQYEYIGGFQEARAGQNSIGRFIKRGQTLQAGLKH